MTATNRYYRRGKSHAINSLEYNPPECPDELYMYDHGFWDGEKALRDRGYVAAHSPQCSARATSQKKAGKMSSFFAAPIGTIYEETRK